MNSESITFELSLNSTRVRRTTASVGQEIKSSTQPPSAPRPWLSLTTSHFQAMEHARPYQRESLATVERHRLLSLAVKPKLETRPPPTIIIPGYVQAWTPALKKNVAIQSISLLHNSFHLSPDALNHFPFSWQARPCSDSTPSWNPGHTQTEPRRRPCTSPSSLRHVSVLRRVRIIPLLPGFEIGEMAFHKMFIYFLTFAERQVCWSFSGGLAGRFRRTVDAEPGRARKLGLPCPNIATPIGVLGGARLIPLLVTEV